MNRRRRNRPSFVAVAAGTCLLLGTAVPWADGFVTGTGQITNIQYGLVNPDEGFIDWVFDDGFGGPAWQGEAWAEVADSFGDADAEYDTGEPCRPGSARRLPGADRGIYAGDSPGYEGWPRFCEPGGAVAAELADQVLERVGSRP